MNSPLHHRRFGLVLAACLFLYGSPAHADGDRHDRHPGAQAPLVALVAPRDGLAVNASHLAVQALVAAFEPHRGKTFVFNGEPISGKNAGHVSHVELAVDGIVIDRVVAAGCGRQLLADFRVDLTRLAAGPHVLTVTAFRDRHARIGRSASVGFTLDPTLPPAAISRLEEALTPTPFACLVLHGEDDDGADDRGVRPLDLEGEISLGGQSDGVDLGQDRIVIALGDHVTLLPPGTLRCQASGHGERTCEFHGASGALVQKVSLEQKRDGTLRFKLKGGARPPDSDRFYLRIGNDWGGIDVSTHELRATLRPALDATRKAQATVGIDGGAIQATDASGVVIRLDVPPGALTRDTLITLTPLLASPLAGVVEPLHAGVKLEPEGLRFALPVSLTLDASATGQPLLAGDAILLVTSPLTVQPLHGAVDPATGILTAQLRHFSTAQGGAASGAAVDLDAVLRALPAPEHMTLEDVEHLIALVRLAVRLEDSADPLCANGFCVAFIQTLSPLGLAALDRIVPANCQSSPATLAAVKEIVRQESLRQELGGNGDPTFSCREGLMRRVIEAAAARATADPSNANLTALFLLREPALAMGFFDVAGLAQNKTLELVGQLQDAAVRQCATDQAGALATLRRLLSLGAGILPLLDALNALDLPRAVGNCAIRITPSLTTVNAGGQVQFTATVAAVIPPLEPLQWSVSPGAGRIDPATGLFTAGMFAGTFHVFAASRSDPEFFGEATVTVREDIRVSVAPSRATIAPNGTAQFTATVTGTQNTGVTWTASGGSINRSTGLFTAGSTAGTFTVRATSVADANAFGEATVTVRPPVLSGSVGITVVDIETQTIAGITFNVERHLDVTALVRLEVGTDGRVRVLSATGINSFQAVRDTQCFDPSRPPLEIDGKMFGWNRKQTLTSSMLGFIFQGTFTGTVNDPLSRLELDGIGEETTQTLVGFCGEIRETTRNNGTVDEPAQLFAQHGTPVFENGQLVAIDFTRNVERVTPGGTFRQTNSGRLTLER